MNRKPSKTVTSEMAAHVRYLIKTKGLYQHQAAALVGVNQGRVSEIMQGQRFPDAPPAQGSFPF